MSGKYIEKGSFKVFLKDQVAADKDISNGATIATYDDAISALRKYAESTVIPVVKFTFVAKDLGLEYTDKDFKEYKKTTDSYKTMVEYYGESQIRNGLQFEKLMKELMKAEDVKDGNYVGYKYENDLVKVIIK